jgi:hypothetical protein
MTTILYEHATEAARTVGLDEDGIRSYEGRGMYSGECFALVGDDFGQLLEVAAILYGQGTLDLSRASTDGMGMGMVLYFPGTTLEDAPSEDDEDDEDGDDDEEADFEPSPDPNWMNP